MILKCPAKVNLFLSVQPPDSTGYHPITSIFQAVGLFDEIHCKPAEANLVTCEGYDLPPTNTITRTLDLLQEVVDLPPMHYHLVKNIPVQSGLGGGSSNAAAVIRMAMRLRAGMFSTAEMEAIASAVGADVPFFLTGGRAKVEGYGEKIEPLGDEETQWLVIAQPEGVTCSTKEMYAKLDASMFSPSPIQGERGSGGEGDDRDATYGSAAGVPPLSPGAGSLRQDPANDFELVAPPECLALKQKMLNLGCLAACLSGSGSAVFGICEDEPHAHQIVRQIQGAKSFVAPTLKRTESLG